MTRQTIVLSSPVVLLQAGWTDAGVRAGATLPRPIRPATSTTATSASSDQPDMPARPKAPRAPAVFLTAGYGIGMDDSRRTS